MRLSTLCVRFSALVLALSFWTALAASASPQLSPPDELFTQEPAPAFTQAELEALVIEFEKIVPQFGLYSYPIEATIVEDPEINASAGIRLAGDDNSLLQAILIVNTGFLDAVKNDRRLIRAVIAHEMAHLALGHSAEWADTKDLDQALTRQEELAADAAGAEYLKALGFTSKDMVDLLLFLDTTLERDYPIWLQTVASDHASPVTRAALIAQNDQVLNALAHLEVGLAFMECRRYEEAVAWFESALAIEPRMHEAQINIALANLQDYYERLPIVIRENWLHPEFIPHLSFTSLLGGRSVAVTDQDKVRFQRALDSIDAIPEGGNYERSKRFLRGTAYILCPTENMGMIENGVDWLRGQLLGMPALWPKSFQVEHLRLANNMAVGLARMGQREEALALLLTKAQEVPDVFLGYAAENIGRLPCAKLDKTQSRQALDLTLRYMQSTPPTAPQYHVVGGAMQNLLKSLGLEIQGELKPAPMYLCNVVSMTIDGETLNLFDPIEKALKQLGPASDRGFLLEKYPDLQCALWGANDVVLLMERGMIMKLTSYRSGTKVELRPSNTSLREVFTISVGMTEDELAEIIDPRGDGVFVHDTLIFGRAALGGATEPEIWTYYPTLNLGVLIENGLVAGIAVTPVKS